jgi:hypothetical protein
MKTLFKMLLLALIALNASACTLRHVIGDDYPQYLSNNVGESNLPQTDKASEYFLPPATRQFNYEFRAAVTGYANLWIVDIGKMLDDTLKSADVQKAFGSLNKIEEMNAAAGRLLVFELKSYTFEGFGAHIVMNISLSRSGNVVFNKTYSQDGKSQGAKMFWGGAFAQKNAVQQSTKLALDEILRQLIADLNALPA